LGAEQSQLGTNQRRNRPQTPRQSEQFAVFAQRLKFAIFELMFVFNVEITTRE
jgi:hypothetical protein